MEKEAMAGEAADVAGNGRMGDPEHAAHLAVPGALGDGGSDGSQELRVAKPVGGREGAMGEGAPAVDASVNPDALGYSGVAIGPTTDETPVGIRVMEVTGWIGAMGGVGILPGGESCVVDSSSHKRRCSSEQAKRRAGAKRNPTNLRTARMARDSNQRKPKIRSTTCVIEAG